MEKDPRKEETAKPEQEKEETDADKELGAPEAAPAAQAQAENEGKPAESPRERNQDQASDDVKEQVPLEEVKQSQTSDVKKEHGSDEGGKVERESVSRQTPDSMQETKMSSAEGHTEKAESRESQTAHTGSAEEPKKRVDVDKGSELAQKPASKEQALGDKGPSSTEKTKSQEKGSVEKLSASQEKASVETGKQIGALAVSSDITQKIEKKPTSFAKTCALECCSLIMVTVMIITCAVGFYILIAATRKAPIEGLEIIMETSTTSTTTPAPASRKPLNSTELRDVNATDLIGSLKGIGDEIARLLNQTENST